MKKTTLVMVCIFFSAWMQAQSSLRKTMPVKEEEVPVAVRNAFHGDFGKIPDDGSWTVDVLLEVVGSKTIIKPLLYTFSKRRPEKIEVRYLPDGKLHGVRGLQRLNRPPLSDTTSSTKV